MWSINKKYTASGKVILWLCLMFFCFRGVSQTFSTRSYGVSTTIYHSVQVLADGYLTCGLTIDTIPNAHFDILFSHFNAFGENIEEYHYGDSAFQYFTQENDYSYLSNYYIQQAVSEDESGTSIARLIWYNDMGDTLMTRRYYSPYYNEQNGNDFINPRYAILLSDSSVYFTAGISDPITANDVCIWHLDKHGNELWHYVYATEADPETCYSMIPWGDGGVMASIFRGIDDSYPLSDLVLLQLNEEGINIGEIDESVWNNYSVSIQAMLYDNGIVCGGSICEPGNENTRYSIWKLNDVGELLWNNPIGDYPPSNSNYTFQTLVKTIDGNYVGTGDFYYLGDQSNSYHADVNPIKISSSDGSVLWQRFYSIVNSQNDIHNAIDLKATPDGGVVFCGHASDAWSQNPNLELPAQQGWIVKLDACGCLVPGCDENCVVGVEETESSELKYFKYGPNPSRDFIHVYLRDIESLSLTGTEIQLHDLQGRLVKSFKPQRIDTTYLLDTEGISAGDYLLSLVCFGKVFQSERVLLVR
jgi:hypothetical protein